MKNINRLALAIFLSVIVLLAFLYMFMLFLPPMVLNSGFAMRRIESYISHKTGMDIKLNKQKLRVSPRLVYSFEAEKIDARDKSGEPFLLLEDIRCVIDIKNLRLKNFYADSAFLDGDIIRGLFSNKKRKSSSYNLNKLPDVGIKSFVYKSKDFLLEMDDVLYKDKKLTFDAEIYTHLLDHDIYIPGASFDMYDNSLFADDVEVNLGKSKIVINGYILGEKNFSLKGFDLPVGDLEKTLLYYQKQQDPAKKFLENFRNYQGLADVDLKISDDGIFGHCFVKNLKADMVWFGIPVEFEEVPFAFDKKRITSQASGTLGGEKIFHDLEIINLGTMEKEVRGELKTTLTKNFRYIEDLKILNTADAKIRYFIRDKKVDIKYSLAFLEGSDLFYKNAYLGLRAKKRKFYFETLKEGDSLFVKNYSYSISENNSYNRLIFGDGLFIKQGDKFVPSYFNCRTNGYAPVSAIGALRRYIIGGVFNGNMKLDLLNEKIFGDFELKNTRFKNFKVKSAKVTARDRVKISAEGLLYGQKFGCNLDAKNKFGDNTAYVYNLDLFLDKFIVQGNHKASKKYKKRRNFKDMKRKFYSRTKEFDVTIDNWKIRLNELKSGRIILRDIFLSGKLQNKIFEFTMDRLSFANGTLEANGIYNFDDDSSSVDFLAWNIDSNLVADTIFGLHNQIEGIANATLHLDTRNKLEDIQAVVNFSVDNGLLPKLGSTEFMLKNKRTIKLMDIIEVDSELRKKKALESDIKGFFRVDNNFLKDINLTTRQQYLSLFIEGEYEMNKQYADLNLYGKYNKEAPRGVKVIFIPLDWILNFVLKPEDTREFYSSKLKRIPPVDTSEENKRYFRVKIQGNLNQDSADVEMKSLRDD